MKVFKQKSERVRSKDNKQFLDFYLAWSYNGKVYSVRINPQFPRDYDKLGAIAQEIPTNEPIEKYM